MFSGLRDVSFTLRPWKIREIREHYRSQETLGLCVFRAHEKDILIFIHLRMNACTSMRLQTHALPCDSFLYYFLYLLPSLSCILRPLPGRLDSAWSAGYTLIPNPYLLFTKLEARSG